MPRIEEAAIERVKRETDLVALVESRGTSLKQKGVNWIGFCPFHEDKTTPNLMVTPSKGLFRCMSSGCGKTGNVIQFVQWFDEVSFREAFEVLSGEKLSQRQKQAPPSREETSPSPLIETAAQDSQLLAKVADYYHEKLLKPEGKAARDYLKSRGLHDEALIKKFKIGLADRTLGLRLPHKRIVAGKEIRERLEGLGVFRKHSGHEHLNGCLTIPITNEKGEVVQLYGRRLGKTTKDNRHLYLARPLAGIFNPEALQNPEIILCESLLDALSFYINRSEPDGHLLKNVTCTYGTENFSNELLSALKSQGTQRVYLAFDGDEAGQKATQKIASKLQKIGIECYQIQFPKDSDANRFAQDQGGNALKQALKKAVYLNNPNEIKENLTPAPFNKIAAKEAELPVKVAKEPSARDVEAKATKEKNEMSEPEFKGKATLEKKGDYYEVAWGADELRRVYRVGGLERNNSLEVLKITLRITSFFSGSSRPSGLHVDSLDLFRDVDRRRFIDRASEETTLEKSLLKRDLGTLLLQLEAAQEERLNKAKTDAEDEAITLSPEEETEAMALLKSPDLLAKIAKAYDEAGIVGEAGNKIAAYLACVSRKLGKPLAIIIQSTSAAGKSTLMEAVLSFFPAEEQVKYSAMTGQSLYYLGENNLKHKILAIVEEEGAEKASYALKLLQSEGELTIASTGKDPHSGRMETQEYHVEGPVALVFTTTSIDIDEELMNRCLVLTVDESQAQTERIHELQRLARTPQGILASQKRKAVIALMQNAQRLLKPWKIANPYAQHLTFTSGRTRTRRDHEKYLTLIDAITLLHQHQRERKTFPASAGGDPLEYIEVTLADIEAANKLAPEVLGRSLDELPPQTRRLLESIKSLVRQKRDASETQEEVTEARLLKEKIPPGATWFGRRELREFTGWSQMQVRRHLERLLELEYLAIRGGRNGVAIKYEFLGDLSECSDGYQVGLLNVESLKQKIPL